MSRAGIWVRAGLHVAMWALLSSPAMGQIGAGTLVGTVVDQAGAVVPGATVTVTSSGTNASRRLATGRDGHYAFGGLLPGTYRVRVESGGFRPLTREGIQV